MARKKILRERVNNSQSFAASGLSLQILNQQEFWSNAPLHPCTNAHWAAFGTTNEDSCLFALERYFEQCDKSGTGANAGLFRTISRRAVVVTSLIGGVFKRQNLKSETIASMMMKVFRGTYDEDIEAMLQDSEEVDEANVRAFDEHLLSTYSLAEDALELDRNAGVQVATDKKGDGEGACESSTNTSDCDWLLSELEQSLRRFQKGQEMLQAKQAELQRAEDEHLSKARANAASATARFMERYTQFLPHTADQDKLPKELPAKLELRVAEVTKFLGCSTDEVLVVFFADLARFGTATASVRDDVEMKANMVCGAKGISIILAAETPSAKGRPTPNKKPTWFVSEARRSCRPGRSGRGRRWTCGLGRSPRHTGLRSGVQGHSAAEAALGAGLPETVQPRSRIRRALRRAGGLAVVQ